MNFLETRSAIAPPKGEKTAEPTPCASSTAQTALFRPVSSNAIIDWTTVDIKNAVKVNRDPAQRIA